jgi:membrane protein implicated in regulation of membrane protease activity
MEWSNAELLLLAALLLGIAEIFVAGFVLACLAVGAVAAAGSAWMGFDFVGQILTASLASILSLIFLRPFAKRWFFSRREVKTGVDALVGRTAYVTQAFDEQSRQGRCKIDGDDWLAVWSDANHLPPAPGAAVRVESVESNTLTVKSLNS